MYIVAKNKNKNGCYALHIKNSKEAVKTKRMLDSEGRNGLQIVAISRPVAYGEYAPYNLVHSINEFVESARNLCPINK